MARWSLCALGKLAHITRDRPTKLRFVRTCMPSDSERFGPVYLDMKRFGPVYVDRVFRGAAGDVGSTRDVGSSRGYVGGCNR
jgi:hypothetical protein